MSEWREDVKAAHDMVSALCRPRGSKGSREWIMSIPARPDYDPDLVITSGLMAAEKHIKELEAQLAACAAGPWRTDVENAPRDGSEVLLYWQHPLLDGTKVMRYMRWDGGVWTDGDLSVTDRWLLAFAVPNPPQVKP